MPQRGTTAVTEYNDVLAQRKKIRKQEERKRNLPLYLMMLPGLVYVFINNYMCHFLYSHGNIIQQANF